MWREDQERWDAEKFKRKQKKLYDLHTYRTYEVLNTPTSQTNTFVKTFTVHFLPIACLFHPIRFVLSCGRFFPCTTGSKNSKNGRLDVG